ncbi:hypothetical protein QR680_006955 [Steinernema hermaphroditum]|uniref:Matrin-type domain-containing protein n=1 Tax=Steinernema hermaphroditum TaxID=289476 RepID=A0AA39HX12_9BILA|nr:hypothetical protein QR680_006955 [Steinernema hermaphroditum]
MDSVLEAQRHLHEERERLVDAITNEFLLDVKTNKERINSAHRSKQMIERYEQCTDKLLSLYEDEHGERAREIHDITGPNEFSEFYGRLKTLKEAYKRKGDTAGPLPLNVEFQMMMDRVRDPKIVQKDMTTFSDEEGYGRFLDMNTLHTEYVNLSGVMRIDYMNYVRTYNKLYEISDTTKKASAYKEYVAKLEAYLLGFIRRSKPLHNIDRDLAMVDEQFAQQWESGKFTGWQKKAQTALANKGAPLDLNDFNSVEELEKVGLDRLKNALMALGMKCGGTLKERSERLFATKGKSKEELEAETKSDKSAIQKAKEEARQKSVASIEAHIYHLAELLRSECEATIENIERKQARSACEDDEETAVTEVVEEESDHEEQGVIYNPKNVPLGWDGKPIPFWLYKLHGLNISYNCEICGNYTYKGPKAFHNHFTEFRHSHGLKCLGIPNTHHFNNITKIEEAVSLFHKVQAARNDKWNAELDEEFEDSHGNVVNRRTYLDLQRQGLL